MKCEPRGKFGGVKLHLEPEEAQLLMDASINAEVKLSTPPTVAQPLGLALKMGKKIRDLAAEVPNLLQERSPEEVAAILVKEVEKATMQLAAVQAKQDFTKLDPHKLEAALLKYVPKK